MAWAPIHVAAVNNDPDALARALAAGAAPDLKEVPTYGHARTPLLLVLEHTKYSCEAAEAKAAQCVAMLLDAGASVTEQNNQGQLPLHLAVQGNFPSIVALLVKAGADVMTRTIEPYDDSDDEDWDLRDSDGGVTPLHLATRTGDHWRCAIILLAAGAQVDYRCPYFSREFTTSPMDIAIHFRRQHMKRHLLRAGARFDARTIDKEGFWCPYLQKVSAAGGFPAYEKAHRARLVATFAPKFNGRLPNEVVGVVMMFYAHIGFY